MDMTKVDISTSVQKPVFDLSIIISPFLSIVEKYTPPKFNIEFTPEKWWLEDDPASYKINCFRYSAGLFSKNSSIHPSGSFDIWGKKK